MNRKLVIYIIIYYLISFLLILLGKKDASSSLGYGIFLTGFWIVAAVILFFLLAKKNIRPKSTLDKIGVFIANPLLIIMLVTIFRTSSEKTGSVFFFIKDGKSYKAKYVYYDNQQIKRIEFYRNFDQMNGAEQLANENWRKDSTWVYFSTTGDTAKKVRYENDIEIK
jgi:hypothetical protein